MTDVIRCDAGPLPQIVRDVSRNNEDLGAFGDDPEGQVLLVDSGKQVCAGDLWDGETNTPPQAPAPGVPYRISRRQGRRQLKAEGLLGAVEAHIAGLDPDDDLRMAYEDASHWHRDDPDVAAMMALLGKSEAEADAFFIAAEAGGA